jgi:1,4-alpha-glucan branching enzyme
MPPQPTARYGLLRIPAPDAGGGVMRHAPLSRRDVFDRSKWPTQTLAKSATFPGWWEADIDALALPDGAYEYEFVIDGAVVADPNADEITRFDGYRGVFHVAAQRRIRPAFDWTGELDAAHPLKQNNQIVIYEMPVKWMSSDPIENPLVQLGTFEEVVFEHLDQLAALGVNCIELLPIADTSQTLNWGYGTRFYFAPDRDMGGTTDAKFFIKACHKRGIRVILDVVMNFFDQTCPLSALAPVWFSVPDGTDGRQSFGHNLFRFATPSYGDYFAGREFLYQMAEFWIAEYHIDGFRVDDFADIQNWEFGQQFRLRATAASNALDPTKPFIVIAEDSGRNFSSTGASAFGGAKVMDAIWNFGYRDEIRRLALNQIFTSLGQPSRTQRVQHLLSQQGVWNAFGSGGFDAGFADMACSVCYVTSHDVADAPRLMNVILGSIIQQQGLGAGDVPTIRSIVDGSPTDPRIVGAVSFALYRVLGVFALLLTSVGIPMFLSGEEFADVHDLDYLDVNTKQQDPVQWARMAYPGQANLLARVAALIHLRTSAGALQRDEIDFFYFHPAFDDDSGPRVFGYARTGGAGRGSVGQVIVLANMGPDKFATYVVPGWPWGATALVEIGNPGAPPPTHDANENSLSLALDAFEVRVFAS